MPKVSGGERRGDAGLAGVGGSARGLREGMGDPHGWDPSRPPIPVAALATRLAENCVQGSRDGVWER